MDFYAVLDQAVELLRQRGRVTYRALKLQFQLDDDQIETLKDELLYAYPQVVDDAGRGLCWTGTTEAAPAPDAAPVPAPGQTPLTYTPPHLAEQILTLEHVMTRSHILSHAYVLTALSEALLLVGRVDEASALVGRLLDLSRTHTGHGHQAHAYRLLGEVARHREPPDVDQAAGHYRRALALSEEIGMRPLQAHCHLGLGTLYAQTGRRQQAHIALSDAIDLYRAMDMTFWLPQAVAALAEAEG
jgi:tetratricopeptide (TPR) repeat protein